MLDFSSIQTKSFTDRSADDERAGGRRSRLAPDCEVPLPNAARADELAAEIALLADEAELLLPDARLHYQVFFSSAPFEPPAEQGGPERLKELVSLILARCRAAARLPALAALRIRALRAAGWLSLAAQGPHARALVEAGRALEAQPQDDVSADEHLRAATDTAAAVAALESPPGEDSMRILDVQYTERCTGMLGRVRLAAVSDARELLWGATLCFVEGAEGLALRFSRRALELPTATPAQRAFAQFLLGQRPYSWAIGELLRDRSDAALAMARFAAVHVDRDKTKGAPTGEPLRHLCQAFEAAHARLGSRRTAVYVADMLLNRCELLSEEEADDVADVKAACERAIYLACSLDATPTGAADHHDAMGLLRGRNENIQRAGAILRRCRARMLARVPERPLGAAMQAAVGAAAGAGAVAAADPDVSDAEATDDDIVMCDGTLFPSTEAAFDAALQSHYPGVEWRPTQQPLRLIDVLWAAVDASSEPEPDAPAHWVCVTRGFTHGGQDPAFARYGHEFVVRVARGPDDEQPPDWVAERLAAVAGYMHDHGQIVARCDRLHQILGRVLPGTPHGLCGPDSVLRGSALVAGDRGTLQFAQLTPIDDEELRFVQLWDSRHLLALMRRYPALGGELMVVPGAGAGRPSLVDVEPQAVQLVLAGMRRHGSQMGEDHSTVVVEFRGCEEPLLRQVLRHEAVTLHVTLHAARTYVAAFVGRLAVGEDFRIVPLHDNVGNIFCGSEGVFVDTDTATYLASADNPVVDCRLDNSTHLWFSTAAAEAIGATLSALRRDTPLPVRFDWPDVCPYLSIAVDADDAVEARADRVAHGDAGLGFGVLGAPAGAAGAAGAAAAAPAAAAAEEPAPAPFNFGAAIAAAQPEPEPAAEMTPGLAKALEQLKAVAAQASGSSAPVEDMPRAPPLVAAAPLGEVAAAPPGEVAAAPPGEVAAAAPAAPPADVAAAEPAPFNFAAAKAAADGGCCDGGGCCDAPAEPAPFKFAAAKAAAQAAEPAPFNFAAAKAAADGGCCDGGGCCDAPAEPAPFNFAAAKAAAQGAEPAPFNFAAAKAAAKAAEPAPFNFAAAAKATAKATDAQPFNFAAAAKAAANADEKPAKAEVKPFSFAPAKSGGGGGCCDRC